MTQNISKYLKENPTLAQHKGNVIELLRKSKIPHKDWFSNDMTNQKIQMTDYLKIQNNYQNLYELLKDYNNSDVQQLLVSYLQCFLLLIWIFTKMQ